MEFIIITGLYIAILFTIIVIWRQTWNKFRKGLKTLERKNLNLDNAFRVCKKNNEIIIEQKNEFEDSILKWEKDHILQVEKLIEKDKEIRIKQAIIESNKREYRDEKEVMNANASVLRKTFEDELAWEKLIIEQLKIKLHKEQIDSNNKELSREKWKAKFEALTHTVETQNNADHIFKKYKSNWKKIIDIYNSTKK